MTEKSIIFSLSLSSRRELLFSADYNCPTVTVVAVIIAQLFVESKRFETWCNILKLHKNVLSRRSEDTVRQYINTFEWSAIVNISQSIHTLFGTFLWPAIGR